MSALDPLTSCRLFPHVQGQPSPAKISGSSPDADCSAALPASGSEERNWNRIGSADYGQPGLAPPMLEASSLLSSIFLFHLCVKRASSYQPTTWPYRWVDLGCVAELIYLVLNVFALLALLPPGGIKVGALAADGRTIYPLPCLLHLKMGATQVPPCGLTGSLDAPQRDRETPERTSLALPFKALICEFISLAS